MEPAALLAEAGRFRKRLRAIRRGRTDISWYPYDPLNSLTPLAGVELPLGNGPIADIGCADGDLSFFLESLGYEVDAIDNAATGANALAGFKALAEKLGSRITLHDRDLDVRFELPRERYSFVFFLGILYHLKNPFGALEALAHVTPHMLLSTRVAQRAPDGTPLRDLPVAYLLDERETNNDPTNYWIFSETGLRRMLTRALWNICAWTSTGATRESDPVARDERVFCLLESRVGWAIDAELVRGWHDVEEGGWRWTERTFAARLRGPGSRLRLAFTTLQPVGISAEVNGSPLATQSFAAPGSYVYARDVTCTGPIEVSFTLDRAMPASADHRELGVIVTALDCS